MLLKASTQIICHISFSFLISCSGGSDSNKETSFGTDVLFEGSPSFSQNFDIDSYQNKKISSSSNSLDGTWIYTQSIDYYYRDILFHPEGEKRHFIHNLRAIVSIAGDKVYFANGYSINEFPLYGDKESLFFYFDTNRFIVNGQLINSNEIQASALEVPPESLSNNSEVEILRSKIGMVKLSENNILSPLEMLPNFGTVTVENSAGTGASETVDIHLFTEESFKWSWVENGVETATDEIYRLAATNIFNNTGFKTDDYDESHKSLVIYFLARSETEDEAPGWHIRVYEPFSPNYYSFLPDVNSAIIDQSDRHGVTGGYMGLNEDGDSVNALFHLDI